MVSLRGAGENPVLAGKLGGAGLVGFPITQEEIVETAVLVVQYSNVQPSTFHLMKSIRS